MLILTHDYLAKVLLTQPLNLKKQIIWWIKPELDTIFFQEHPYNIFFVLLTLMFVCESKKNKQTNKTKRREDVNIFWGKSLKKLTYFFNSFLNFNFFLKIAVSIYMSLCYKFESRDETTILYIYLQEIKLFLFF